MRPLLGHTLSSSLAWAHVVEVEAIVFNGGFQWAPRVALCWRPGSLALGPSWAPRQDGTKHTLSLGTLLQSRVQFCMRGRGGWEADTSYYTRSPALRRQDQSSVGFHGQPRVVSGCFVCAEVLGSRVEVSTWALEKCFPWDCQTDSGSL